MKTKRFYSLVAKDDIMGIKEHLGYQIVVDDTKFNVYVENPRSSSYPLVHIIDPKSGLAIFTRSISKEDDEINVDDDSQCIQVAVKDMIDRGLISKYLQHSKLESYKIMKDAFKVYKSAYKLYKKHQDQCITEKKRGDWNDSTGSKSES